MAGEYCRLTNADRVKAAALGLRINVAPARPAVKWAILIHAPGMPRRFTVAQHGKRIDTFLKKSNANALILRLIAQAGMEPGIVAALPKAA